MSKPHILSRLLTSSVVRISRQFLLPYRWTILLMVLINLVSGFLQVMQPLVLAPVLSFMTQSNVAPAESLRAVNLNNAGPTLAHWFGIEDEGRRALVVTVILLYAGTAVLVAASQFAGYYLSTRVRTRALHDMLNHLHDCVLGLPLAFFNRSRAGDLVSRFTSDTTSTMNNLEAALRKVPAAALRVLFTLFLMIRTAPLLSLSVLGVGLMHFLITRLLGNRVKRATANVSNLMGRVSSVVMETIQSIRVIKSFGAEAYERGRFRKTSETLRISKFKFAIARYADEPLRLVADSCAIGVILYLSFLSLEQGAMTLSGFIMFVYLSREVIAPISDIAKNGLALFSVEGNADRLIRIYDTPNLLVDGIRVAQPLEREITMERIEFSYATGTPILRDVSLSIRKGEMLAFVGPSGAGKSTAADLVLRLYDPQQGRVLWDGVDIREFSRGSYLSHFGVVSQECLLLNATIRENVVYGREDDPVRLEESLRVANAWDFVSEMPKGVETQVGDRGVNVSGGQRQRLAIARAMYGRPQVIIFDEATSALDTESEHAVQTAVDNVIRDATAIVIAHRLSTIQHANRVAVMKDGCLEAVGTHDELLASSDTYRRLHRLQAGTAPSRASSVP